MAEYIEREAVGKAYMDLCRAKSRLEKARRGAAFFSGDLLPDVEPTTKELFSLIMAVPAADVAPVVRCKDCQSFQADGISAPNTGTCWRCEMVRSFDDFCSYGERKD